MYMHENQKTHTLFHKEPEHRQQGQKEVFAEVIL